LCTSSPALYRAHRQADALAAADPGGLFVANHVVPSGS
jgi:hypothetical protein